MEPRLAASRIARYRRLHVFGQDRDAGSQPSPFGAWLQLTGLWGVAITLPLLELLGRTPEFFVARGNPPGDIVFMTLALAVGVPSGLLALELLVRRRSKSAAHSLHLALVALLATGIALPPAGALTGGSAATIPIALVGGVAVAALFERAAGVRSFASTLAAVPALVAVFFLAFSPASALVFRADDGGAAAQPAAAPHPLVLIVFDELPTTSLLDGTGELADTRFPGFARLASDATWYRNATTVAEKTTSALPALLSGQIAGDGDLPLSADFPRNLFTMLAPSHELEVIEPLTRLCPPRLCRRPGTSFGGRMRSLASDLATVTLHLTLPAYLEERLAPINLAWSDFGDDHPGARLGEGGANAILEEQDEIAHFERLADAIGRPGERPPALFLHSGLPHAPWDMLPTGQRYRSRESVPGLDGEAWGAARAPVRASLERHMLQAALADRLLLRTLATLERTGVYDDAMVIVVSDHGASFKPDTARREATAETLPDIAGVPLFVKEPGQSKGRIDDLSARTVDIVPTIAAAMDAAAGWRFDGAPLGGPDRRSSAPVRLYRSGRVALTTPLMDFSRAQDRIARHQSTLLRDGDATGSLYLRGPAPGLLGRRLSELRLVSPPGAYGATLDAPEAWSDVEPDAPVLPLEVTGTVMGIPPGRPLAVALNGSIVATTATYADHDGEVRFLSLLPFDRLRAGANAVAVLARVRDSALAPLARSAER